MTGAAAAPSRGHARVFFALWPDADVRAALGSLASTIRVECGGRATPAPKIHLTLVFVGQIERERLGMLRGVGGEVRASPFDLVFDRLGYFRHTRIAWLGTASCPPALASLVTQLREKLGCEGLKTEDRPYVPHITLVRDAGRKPGARASPALSWRAADFALVESVTSQPSRYETIESWPLR